MIINSQICTFSLYLPRSFRTAVDASRRLFRHRCIHRRSGCRRRRLTYRMPHGNRLAQRGQHLVPVSHSTTASICADNHVAYWCRCRCARSDVVADCCTARRSVNAGRRGRTDVVVGSGHMHDGQTHLYRLHHVERHAEDHRLVVDGRVVRTFDGGLLFRHFAVVFEEVDLGE